MIKKIALVLCTVLFSIGGIAQENDTIFYKSGAVKVVEITSFNDAEILYKTDGKVSSVNQITVAYFKMYDNEGVLTYSSNDDSMDQPEPIVEEQPVVQEVSDVRELSVSRHTLALNPFLLPFISPSLKYNFTFGKKMQYSVTSRVTYLSPVLSDFDFYGDLLVGVGFRLTPFYVKHFAFGVDFTPMFGFDVNNSNSSAPEYLFPLNLNFDFFVNQNFGFTFDVGAGTVVRNTVNTFPGGSSVTYNYLGRIFFGVLWQFNEKRTFEVSY